ncbi:hypothetical protein [Pedobacter sp. SYP-B3415]|nr:hypothetical protein [Pedobacter sp. SYP-B3415]
MKEKGKTMKDLGAYPSLCHSRLKGLTLCLNTNYEYLYTIEA